MKKAIFALLAFSAAALLIFVLKQTDEMSKGVREGLPFQSMNWLGSVERESESTIIRAIHLFDSGAFPETPEWIVVTPPLRVKLFTSKGHVEEISLTEFRYSFGCNEYPTFKAPKTLDGEFLFALPQNDAANWMKGSTQNTQLADAPTTILPDHEWEKLSEKLAHQIRSEDSSARTLSTLQKSSVKKLAGITYEGLYRILFADLEIYFKGEGFSVHRMYQQSPSGGFDIVDSPYASKIFWGHSYKPNYPILINTKSQTNLALQIGTSLFQSMYILFNHHGWVREHNFLFGEEDCE